MCFICTDELGKFKLNSFEHGSTLSVEEGPDDVCLSWPLGPSSFLKFHLRCQQPSLYSRITAMHHQSW